MSSEKNYTNPEFTEAFQRVKKILIDLKNKIIPVKQGNAANFRKNINDAIGTIPETDQETGAITKDGYGMSGAVFAMGEAVEIVLESIGDTLNNFDKDAQATLDDKVKKEIAINLCNDFINRYDKIDFTNIKDFNTKTFYSL